MKNNMKYWMKIVELCLFCTQLMYLYDLEASAWSPVSINRITTTARKRFCLQEKYNIWNGCYGWYYSSTSATSSSSLSSRRMEEGEKEKEEEVGDSGMMIYDKDTITRQSYTYQQIRKAGGSDVINDVYVRNPKLPSYLWFVGKVARCTGTATLQDAIGKQWNLIIDHATQLRPMELGRDKGLLEIWCAPGDSEVEMEANRNPMLKFCKLEEPRPGTANAIPSKEVGFKPEFVTSRGQAFRVERTKEELDL